jgi:hypothetical protein
MAWHGMAWHGMVWYGMVWHGRDMHGTYCRSYLGCLYLGVGCPLLSLKTTANKKNEDKRKALVFSEISTISSILASKVYNAYDIITISNQSLQLLVEQMGEGRRELNFFLLLRFQISHTWLCGSGQKSKAPNSWWLVLPLLMLHDAVVAPPARADKKVVPHNNDATSVSQINCQLLSV